MKILAHSAGDVGKKLYLFRGVSDANYSKQNDVALKSRFFSYELSEYLSKFGYIQVFEVLDDSKIYDYGESVFDFCEENDLLETNSNILYTLYGIHNLTETAGMDTHDEYHSYQVIATEYLENHTNYDGIVWYDWIDDLEYQVQIWNMSILRKLSKKEAEQLISELAEEYPDTIYSNPDHENALTENGYYVLSE